MSLAPDFAASPCFERRRAADRALLLVGAWALLVGAALALRPIVPIDETRYLSVAWEMWLRGDFLVPHLNGLPYSDKPPLLFWLFHLGWWLFGVEEWWPRLVPSLFALANLFLTAALARRLWPDRRGVAKAAPWILLGLLLWSVYTTMVMFDMLVTFFVLLALLGLHAARCHGGVLPWLQVGAALGLGMLAKGPVVLMLPLFVAVLVPWWGRGMPWKGAAGWRWGLGVLGAVGLGAVLALAWALPAAAAGGVAYGKAILFSQTEGRLVHSFAHGRPWWWYLALLPALLYPYSLWAPLWSAGLRQRSADSGVRFTLASLLPGLVVFSLISGKQPHYLLPLMPGFALLAARLLDEPAPAPRPWSLLPPLGFLFFVGGAMAAAPWAAGWLDDLPAWAGSVSPGAGFVLLAAGVAFVLLFERLFAGRRATPSLLTLALVVAAWAGFSEASRQAFDLGALARYLSVAEQQRRPIAYVGDYQGELHFLGRLKKPFREIPLGAERRWLRRHPRGKVVQDLRYVPREIDRVDFTQPYRGDVLAVWSRGGLQRKTSR